MNDYPFWFSDSQRTGRTRTPTCFRVTTFAGKEVRKGPGVVVPTPMAQGIEEPLQGKPGSFVGTLFFVLLFCLQKSLTPHTPPVRGVQTESSTRVSLPLGSTPRSKRSHPDRTFRVVRSGDMSVSGVPTSRDAKDKGYRKESHPLETRLPVPSKPTTL